MPASKTPDNAEKMAREGPVKQEPCKRRVRGLLGNKWVFDTLDAEYVWEHPYYPVFYIPLESLQAGPVDIMKEEDHEAGFWTGTLKSKDKSAGVVGYEKGPLKGLVKIAANEIEYFAESEKLLGPHPKDPYKRIECLQSDREIRIEVKGAVVARSTSSVFLFETMLRTRYYLPRTSIVDWAALVPSESSTFCPYKGQASYYHLRVGDELIEDAVWYYAYPTLESAAVQDRLCFYNEKVDVYVDGVKEAR